ncbi:ATP-binding cassette domain-containing protein [Rhizobium sp.]
MPDKNPVIEAKNLGFSVPGRQILGGIDLAISHGEVAALVGHNGSGKSTLIKILARQQRATAGTLTLESRPIDAFGAREFSRKVAYLPQDLTTASGMTVRELVACGRYPWHGALGRFTDEDRAKVEEAITLSHLEPFADRAVETLSGGERQRAWIAMLLAQDANCLLLDEPISALDITHQIEVLALVQSLTRQKALSVAVVLHDINMAARFCDSIHALKAGRIIASGTSAEMMTADVLKDIYGIDMNVMPHPSRDVPLAYVA